MKKTIKFGMKAEEGAGRAPFVLSESNDNPYGIKYFNATPLTIGDGSEDDESHITSIPSPYATMHLVNVALMELNAGKGQQSDDDFKKRWDFLPKAYKKAISHCLDMYEMFFYFKELDIYTHGIKIEKIDLVTKRGDNERRDCEQLLGERDSFLSRYIDTLDLYRERYITEIRNVRPANYKFDFKSLYVFRDKNGVIFGGTSPFTGFFAKSDCNLSDLKTEWKINDRQVTHKLFTSDVNDWMPLSKRSSEFKRFMYLLLKDDSDKGTGLGKVFKSLWETVRNAIVMWEGNGSENDLRAQDLNANYPEFNFGGAGLPKIQSRGEDALFLRTTDFDKTHMKYLLYLYYSGVDIKVTEEECNEDIKSRRFPKNGLPCRWVSVNDLLSDALYILPYEINDNYVAIDYTIQGDPQQKKYRRCLLPIKKEVLNYLDIRPAENVGLIEEIAKNITIVQHKRTNPDGNTETYFVVTLKIKLEGRSNGEVLLRREYCTYYKHPNGIIIEPKELEYFAFGIYPFVRSTSFDNMYKVLFYNKFNAKVQDEKGFKLEFYHMKNGVPTKYDNGEMNYNCTYSVFNSGFDAQKFNSIYYNVEKAMKNENDENEEKAPSYIEFVELFCHIKNNPIKATALIAPKLKKIESMDRRADIAVDLGTSNTYVAYQIVGDAMDNPEVQDVCSTHHPQGGDTFNELVFMNLAPTRDQKTQKGNYFNFEEKFEHDLYLPPFDNGKRSDTQAWTVCMPTQLSEFMPARIVKSGDNGGFSFPIPTVINNYSKITDKMGENLPMIHSAIPFAYYDIGKRTGGKDNISDGNFKWCLRTDGNSDPMKVNSLGLYINELLFMVRTHLLCEKINLSAVRLVWTFPLSFTDELVRLTKERWEKAFKKYFGVATIENSMFNVNESLAPYHSLGADNQFNLLMDIGGGSTDVVGYYNWQPVFITSFGFAGNALYMTSNKNKNNDLDTSMESADRNIIKKQLQRSTDIKDLFERRSSYFSGTELIPLGGKLSNVMNYGFTKHHEQFESFFRNPTYKLEFLALFHNAALVYHIAQISYTKKPEELPRTLYMAGNGSNLFKLKSAEFGINLVKKIFKAYYGKTDEFQVQLLDRPKTSAAEGALKIINDKELLKYATLKTQYSGGENEKEIIVYTFGDIDEDNHKMLNIRNFASLDRTYDNPGGAKLEEMRMNLQKNAISFIEMFDKVVCGDMHEKYPDGITKDWLIKKVKDIAFDNTRLQVGRYISDSYFFNYIALLMESISLKMIENVR